MRRLGNLWGGEHTDTLWEAAMHGEGMEVPQSPPTPTLCPYIYISCIWLFLSCILYNKTVILSIVLSWVL